MSFLSEKILKFQFEEYIGLGLTENVDVDSLNTSILGDDVEKFSNEIKQEKYVNAGYEFYLHQLLNRYVTQKMKAGDKLFLKNLVKTLYDRQIPVFDKDDPLFLEFFCARFTFTVSK